ncbi:MAG: PepSY-like domain-containing protein [Bacteroidota bacterium]|nr:PepSY-like domain-containing protein [Bacteroidota bacterium]
MKKIVFLLTASLLFSLMGFTQEVTTDKVPPAVKTAFTKKYPSSTDVKYQMDKKDYSISFKDKGNEMSSVFNAYGRWVETSKSITETELPKKVMKSVNKNFSGFAMSDISSLETPNVKLCYKMILKGEKMTYEVRFSPKGEILRRIPLKKEKQEKEEPLKK